jgi:glycerophosphoryl diester phosphodiesterase
MVHRGEAGQAPENTRPALLRCIEDGLEWAEVDVRRTADGHHILAHDDRLSDGLQTVEVKTTTLARLKSLDLGLRFADRYRGEPPMSLVECLALAKGRLNLCLDCKAVDPAQLAGEILAAGMESQVVIYNRLDGLRAVEAAAPGRLALMTKWRPGIDPVPWVRTNHLAAVEVDADQVTPDLVREFHAVGIKVQAKALGEWDVPEQWDRVASAGVDWVQTDLPEEFLGHLLLRRMPVRPVRFSLHRGAMRYAPENTLPAFEKAIRLGADFVEFDVRTTSDGKFYLLHDSSLDGKTDGHGLIQGTPSGVIERLSAGVKFGRPYGGVRMPALDPFLAAVSNRVDLYFDAKAIQPEALAEAVRRSGTVERTVVYQSPEYLKRLKAIEPRIRLLPPLRNPVDLEAFAADLRPYGVDVDWDILSRELIARCHALGIQVFSDALGPNERIEDYLQAIDWGIDVIQTDHPLRLMRALELRVAGAHR